jgi:hypothetical protein
MLNESDGDLWVFRRDHRITTPLARLTKSAADGTPYLAPEVQLLFKSGPHRREKNEEDFEVALPKLDDESREWLRDAIAMGDAAQPWLARLESLRQLGGVIGDDIIVRSHSW